MNQENKFGEIKEKLLQYWAVFLAACGKFWDKTKVCAAIAWDWLRRNGRVLLQKLAAWLLKAREWLIAVWQNLRVKGKEVLKDLPVWLAAAKEKLRPIPGQIKAGCLALVARVKGEPAPEALPAAKTPKALPEAQESETAIVEAEETEEPAEAAPEAPAEPETGNPYLKKALAILAVVGKYTRLVIKWIWKLRRIFMAIPVIWYAVKFAMENMERLPEQVGLDIQSTGEFARMISRQEAVYWPLGITAFCLLLMFCSKKPVLPWVISMFTLVLPWLIWILNYYA